MESVSGTVDSVVYEKESTGYAVLRLSVSDGSQITLVGCVPQPVPGEMIAASGHWTEHPSFGRQFNVSSCERVLPATSAGLLLYLKSGILPGVGAVTAKSMLERFGTGVLNIIENDPEQLTSIRGISKKRATEIGRAFSEQNVVRRLIEFLTAHKLPPYHAMRLYKSFGAEAMQRLNENPYLLLRPPFDVLFEHADALASSLGVAPDSDVRLRAAVLYELYYNLDQGHCFIPFNKLCAVSLQLLGLDDADMEKIILSLTDGGKIIRENTDGKDACYLSEVYVAETNAAEHIIRLTGEDPPAHVKLTEYVDDVEKTLGITLEKRQREAVFAAAHSNLFVLTGGPGTGKTTTVRAIVELFGKMRLKTALAAPTGRAAKRMSEVCGRDASTIHRLLGVVPDAENGGFRFEYCADNPLPFDAVIIDETSMVDMLLMSAMLDALDGDTRLILVGDADQLPAVGPGNVLEDLLNCGRVDFVRLTEIFRQAADSRIITGAHAVNAGELPELTNQGDLFCLGRLNPEEAVSTITDLVLKRLPENMGVPSGSIQVLTPTRLGLGGTRHLNGILQEALNPPSPEKNERRFGNVTFREGDRVMQIKNNYDILWTTVTGDNGAGVFNGDIGKLIEVDTRAERAVVRFDDGRTVSYPFDLLGELEPAYAMTVHKAQGSEYPAVVLAHMPCPKTLMTRRVLYTAMTRAKDLLVMVGDKRVLSEMTANGRKVTRYSGLLSRLRI